MVHTSYSGDRPRNTPVTLTEGAKKECPICGGGCWTMLYDLTENREVPVQIPHDKKAHGLE
jgi:hypothetical protein